MSYPGTAGTVLLLDGAAGTSRPGASTEVLRQRAAAALQRCHRWLEQAVPAVPQLGALVPVTVTAAQLYGAGQYDACLSHVVAVCQAAQRAQAALPQLPRL